MGYWLAQPDDPITGGVRGIARVATPPSASERGREDEGPGEGRLVRTVRMPLAEAPGYLARWLAEPGPAAHPLAAPYGVTARERRRADRLVPGAHRRQRLAMAADGDVATAVHWSAREPLGPADAAAWDAAVARLTRPPESRGWTA
ncbi:hypothetical protein [Miltoncostaea marina]|uniref:hypothetical protein n=1 Tax=Miltoncostaea marina TaxID=2843215 RepID=UPI001C3C3412|nr:hypothetical protein [Miltoncostaea marina]